MKIQNALEYKGLIRRESWEVETAYLEQKDGVLHFIDTDGNNEIENGPIHEVGFDLDVEDLLADDWVLNTYDIYFKCRSGTGDAMRVSNQQGDIEFLFDNFMFYMEEEDVDNLLSFLKNNTKVGKERIL